MSTGPAQPPNTRSKRDLRWPLLALGLVLVAITVVLVVLLALSNGGGGPPAAPTATPTVTATAVNSQSTPPRIPGVGGPQHPTETPSPLPTPTATPSSTSTREVNSPTALPTFTATPLAGPLLTLQRITEAVVPPRDSYSLTDRLKLKSAQPIPHTTNNPPGNYQVGHTDTFNISDVESRNYYSITATVREITDHAYWYVQDGQPVDRAAIDRLAQAFEQKIYPTDRAIFGSEWTPGVDNDPRITVLFAPLRGAGGSYSAADEFTRLVNPFSNEREMFYISTSAGYSGLESTLAHEFQHMIHWNEHPNQDIWLNEGASVLASALNGYDVQGVDNDFMHDADVQLNAWEPSPAQARPNYGAAFLFLDYLRNHYGGDKIIRAVIDAPQPGTETVDTALASLGYEERFVDVFEQWVLSNLLDSRPGVTPDLRYTDRAVQVAPQVTLDNYPTGHSGQVAQFGTEYIQLDPTSEVTGTLHVDFAGRKENRVIGAPAHSGTGIYWSNRGDLSDPRMTREFDLRGVRSATLDCYVWYNIEQDFDYAYIEASTDGGVSWDTLKGKYTSSTNPNGTNYGNAYTGVSSEVPGADANGWLHERIDLSRYAGSEVLLRYEYITDDGYNAQGFAVDDISISELGYSDNAERDSNWQMEGFVRVENRLPQTYYLAIVRLNDKGFDVQRVALDANAQASFDIEGLGPGGPYDKAVLVISGTTPHNILPASYNLSVRSGP